jgi:hypothetical protein
MNVLERRQRLCAAGYIPIPLFGKVPPNKKNNARKSLTDWEQTRDVTDELLAMWSKVWPDAKNTGLLTRSMPTLDLDILNEEAVRTIEAHVREHYEEAGHVLVRIGKAPKRAIPFRTEEPFAKFVINLVAPNGSEEKIEFLADGAQVAAFGIHPETQKPFQWFGGAPGEIALQDLPYIRETQARALVDDLVRILTEQFGYIRAKERPRKARHKGNGAAAGDDTDPASAQADWKYLYDNILAGRELHNSLRDLAAKLVKSGMNAGAAINQLRALLNASKAPRDDRFKDRLDDIPRLVETAEDLVEAPTEQASADQGAAATPSTIDETLAVFERWLILKDATPILAVLGAVAANLLPGDPVWVGIVGPPSSAKTEILNSLSLLPKVAQIATLTPPGLLSGTPKKQAAKGTQGGLLRQIGDFGIAVLKDFGSILSMHPETKAEVLAALREIYDGSWTRVLGTDGGRTLTWKGKLGLIFACTAVIDTHYAVLSSMGDRLLLNRLAPAGREQFPRALKHLGSATPQMRKELAEAVAQLFAGHRAVPRPISDEEVERINRTIMLVVRLRGSVERDRRNRELEMVYGAEGTARIGLALERLLAGLDVLGVDRASALNVVEAVAMDSVPPYRRQAYEFLRERGFATGTSTATLAKVLALPSVTTRRVLEDLTSYGLIERRPQGQGKADLWCALPWDEDE